MLYSDSCCYCSRTTCLVAVIFGVRQWNRGIPECDLGLKECAYIYLTIVYIYLTIIYLALIMCQACYMTEAIISPVTLVVVLEWMGIGAHAIPLSLISCG